MSTTTKGPQSASELAIELAASIATYTVGAMIWKYVVNPQSALSWSWGLGTGTVMASVNVARRYYRQSQGERLDPVVAIGFSLFCIVVVVGSLAIGWAGPPDATGVRVLMVGGLCLLIGAPLYLIGAACAQYLRTRRVGTRRGGGT